MNGVVELLLNIAAGLLTAVVVWLAQWSVRHRRLQRTRAFFGLPAGSDCLLVVNRHYSSGNELSVHRRDVFALLELAGLIQRCGARPEVVAHDEVRQGFGEKAEFCIGGPASNSRAAAHLEWKVSGVEVGDAGAIRAGDTTYPPDQESPYVLLAKVTGPQQSRPVFLVSGQRAITNQAAVRYLVTRERQLARTYGDRGRFCLVLRVVNPQAYGPDVVDLVADVTQDAFTAPEATPATARLQ
jgi:hypothetical protein